MSSYYVRICWNTGEWKKPTGDATRFETGTHSAREGFGYEEWLFKTEDLIDGYKYAFLQGLPSHLRTEGDARFDVTLWSIGRIGLASKRFYVGKIANCEAISDEKAAVANDFYKKSGWLDRMREDLDALEPKAHGLSEEPPFNIRFKLGDAIRYDQPYPEVGPSDQIAKQDRYKFILNNGKSPKSLENNFRTRKGQTTLPERGGYHRGSSEGVTVAEEHRILQRTLMSLLKNEFGEDHVVREDEGVDLKVSTAERKLLIEIKTSRTAKDAVREALGQILEYAYYHPNRVPHKAELFIVAPGRLDDAGERYLKLLKKEFGIPIRYCQFESDDKLPKAFLNPL